MQGKGTTIFSEDNGSNAPSLLDIISVNCILSKFLVTQAHCILDPRYPIVRIHSSKHGDWMCFISTSRPSPPPPGYHRSPHRQYLVQSGEVFGVVQVGVAERAFLTMVGALSISVHSGPALLVGKVLGAAQPGVLRAAAAVWGVSGGKVLGAAQPGVLRAAAAGWGVSGGKVLGAAQPGVLRAAAVG